MIFPWLSILLSLPYPSALLVLPGCFIHWCLLHNRTEGKCRKGVTRYRYMVLTLWKIWYQKAWNFSSPFCSFYKLCKVPELKKVWMLASFTFSASRSAKWPKPWTEQDNLWSMVDVPLSLFPMVVYWLLLDFCVLLISESWSHPNFWKARLFLADYESHSLVFWLFVKFLWELF